MDHPVASLARPAPRLTALVLAAYPALVAAQPYPSIFGGPDPRERWWHFCGSAEEVADALHHDFGQEPDLARQDAAPYREIILFFGHWNGTWSFAAARLSDPDRYCIVDSGLGTDDLRKSSFFSLYFQPQP